MVQQRFKVVIVSVDRRCNQKFASLSTASAEKTKRDESYKKKNASKSLRYRQLTARAP